MEAPIKLVGAPVTSLLLATQRSLGHKRVAKGAAGLPALEKSIWKLPVAESHGKPYALVGNIFIMSKTSLIRPNRFRMCDYPTLLYLNISLSFYKQMCWGADPHCLFK